MKSVAIFTAVMVGLPFSAFGEMSPVLDTAVSGRQGTGCIDWTGRCILSRGIGAPNLEVHEAARRPGAIRAAQQIALRNALETIKGMYLNSSTTVEHLMVKDDAIASKISGFLKGFEQKGKEKYMSDGTVEVTMTIPLDGVGNIDDRLFAESDAEAPSVSSLDGHDANTQTEFTGLIVDCKGIGLKPALNPRIFDESGKEVYGAVFASRQWVIKHGIAGYCRAADDKMTFERLGKIPAKIKALKSSGGNATDAVISDSDAAQIRRSDRSLQFLSECRVVFIID